MIQVTVWNEFRHEKRNEEVAKLYPEGIHIQIAKFLQCSEIDVTTAWLDLPEHGLSDTVLENTDVLIWWGHTAHGEVKDEIVEKIYQRVLRGMGLIVLHSGHHSKIFKKLMGTTCNLKWSENNKERVWTVNPAHPIAKGVPEYFEFPQEELYGERFDIPQPDDVVFLSWFQGGYVFRSGCTFTRGLGKIFYFQPGHETNPIFYDEVVQTVIRNAVHWAAPDTIAERLECPHCESLERC